MSQTTPPPAQPSEPQPSAPQPETFGYPAAPVGAAPVAAPVRRTDNLAGGLLTAFAVAVVAAGVYGGIAGALEREIGYAAVGVGFVIALAACKVGGRSVWLFVVSAVFALGATYLGQLLEIAIIVTKHTDESVTDLFTGHFGALTDTWKEAQDFMGYLFLALSVVGAYSGAKKANG
ncbi:hypothetical protein [Streptomyces beijiangensis]|uniref:Uncharacterized protein n=1 Tax=Streptomyces beijiangensis TaxID=163361 RepID=A0A939FFV1_9ACTN|nr:hypothetical protein [Streptomyces beijiangensis]MBO0517344.1 hypothetical protein [Streptomyces beijiangensis]